MRGPNQFEPGRYLKMALIDFVLFFVIVIFSLGFIGSIVLLLEADSLGLPVAIQSGVFLFSVVAVWFMYFCFFLKKMGQTFAMRVFKYKVVPINKNRLSWGQVIWWGIVLSNPVTILLDVLNTRLPPYITLVESRTDTRIIDFQVNGGNWV